MQKYVSIVIILLFMKALSKSLKIKVILLMKICGNFLMKMELNWMKNILKEL